LLFPQHDSGEKEGELLIPLEAVKQRIIIAMNSRKKTTWKIKEVGDMRNSGASTSTLSYTQQNMNS
jgi:hypothetical protein